MFKQYLDLGHMICALLMYLVFLIAGIWWLCQGQYLLALLVGVNLSLMDIVKELRFPSDRGEKR